MDIFKSKLSASWLLVIGYLGFLFLYIVIDFGFEKSVILGFSGILQGTLIFLVAAGFSIIFGLLDVLNFAQGGFFMVGAYIGIYVYLLIPTNAMPAELAFLIALLAACLSGLVLGLIVEVGLIRPLYERPVYTLLLTFGLSSIMRETVLIIWGPAPVPPPPAPPLLDTQLFIFGQPFSVYRLFIIIVGIGMMLGVMLMLRFTRIGIIIRAGLEDREMVQALGINVRQMFTLVFVVGTMIAALGGMVVTPFRGAFVEMGDEFLLSAIVVVIIGGIGSYEGTAIASIMVGLTRVAAAQISIQYFQAPVLEELSVFAIMIIVLLIQPSGLFGRKE